MSCNCNSGDTPEYYITLDGVGTDGYSPEINVTQEDIDSFRLNLINKNNEQLTPVIPKLSYLNDNFVTNGVFSATLANYSTTAQIAATYLSKTDAATSYLKVDGSNANNPITINNLSIQSIGTGTRIGSSGGALTLQGSGVRPAYLQTGSTSKSLALYTDLPTRTSQLTNDSGFLTVSDITNKMETNGSNAANTVNLKSVELSGNISSTETEFKIQNSNGDVYITSLNNIYLDTGSSGDLYYDGNEVATVNQIPTVNNSTITLTQGGVVKGSFTLNQSGSATIALDSGGSTIGNQISLITEDNTRSLTLGVDNTTKKVIANYNLISGGSPFLTLPLKLISSATAPILMSESSDNGLYNIDLAYNANCLTLDTNNKLTVDSDYIEAHKAYLADGDTLTDPQGLQDVKYYNYSSFDKSKFTKVGSPTITDDGIASGLGNNNYLNTGIIIGQKPFKIRAKVNYLNTISGQRIFQIGLGGNQTFTVYTQIYGSNPTQLRASGTLSDDTTFADGINNISGDIIAEIEFTGSEYILRAYDINETLLGSKTLTSSSLYIKNISTLDLYIGTNATGVTYDLKQFSVTVDGVEVFNGNKTGVDTYTIGSDIITIPYKVSKTGSKIVDSSLRPEVEAVYEDHGYAPYYTLDETNGNFTLPMGEIYGYITRLEGIVKDLQTRLTALESNINGGGAGVVQQGLLGMSPLSLGRPQLLDELTPEDEMNTMDIGPSEEITQDEVEPQPIENELAQEEIEEEPQEIEEEGGENE